ncbi:hypothetical protein KKH46_02445, partial [Patescibacteria group bacterium]|nr:hypothetical protein [Patescibacteria group bacterium]
KKEVIKMDTTIIVIGIVVLIFSLFFLLFLLFIRATKKEDYDDLYDYDKNPPGFDEAGRWD